MLKPFSIIICAIFLFIALLCYIFQRHIIYFPDRMKPRLQDYDATDMSDVLLHTKDNLVLTSWYKPALNNQPTLLFLHGNAGHIGHRMPLIRQFIDAGFGVFLLEYRGYGGNEGSPTEQGLYEDARTAMQYLYQNGIKSNQIALYGESLGTGVATKIAVENPICAVILQSPYTSLVSVAHYHYRWLILKPWDRFNSLGRIKEINAPLLVLHGKHDEIVTYNEGVTLFNQANEPKKMLHYDHKNHNDLWNAPGFSEEIIHFVRAYCA